ncbi:MAG: nitroreductase family protein [Firmicutes bacterium]|nr:nitroreductase family protein [Bacillota bacterium]
MNEVTNTILQRRSIRSYRNEQITEDQLNTILLAGEYAPSGMGEQATMMVAVQDPEIIAKMSGLNAAVMGADTDPFYGAPTVIVVFADKDRITCVEDGSLVIGSMMLAAASIDVDSCWIHRAKETFETEDGRELKQKWGVPDNYIGVGNCILGYRDGELPQAAARKPGRIVRV